MTIRMTLQPGNAYFENQVLTASPERLQFMLLDAALRAARKAEDLLMAESPVQAGVELAFAESILADMLGSMRMELAPELVEKAGSIYIYMLKQLCDAHLADDLRALRNALRVLEVEHETWRLASQKQSGGEHRTPAPHISFDGSPAAYQGGLTLEA
jgi:flagellar protein FliS